MELLRITDQAMVAGEFPYETRSVQTGIILASGAGTVDSRGVVAFGGVNYVPDRARRVDEPEALFRAAAVSELSHLWPYATQQGAESLRIAEKSIGLQIVNHVLSVCPRARVVMLDRDPRDVFVSVLHFNERRGYVGFGAELGPDELAGRIADYYREAGSLIKRWGRRAHTVRYATMLSHPIDTIRAVTGSTADLTVHAQRIAEVSAPEHVTSPSTDESVERWRREGTTWSAQFAVLARAHEQFLDLSRASAAIRT
jgi:hypothetical protein